MKTPACCSTTGGGGNVDVVVSSSKLVEVSVEVDSVVVVRVVPELFRVKEGEATAAAVDRRLLSIVAAAWRALSAATLNFWVY